MPTVRGMYMAPGSRGGSPVVVAGSHEPGDARGLSTWEVVELTGLSYRMIDYWSRTSALLRPSIGWRCGSGSRRLWTPTDVERIVKAARFSKALSPKMGGGQRSTQGVAVETIEQFVREATLNSVGDWVWECDDFTLIVAGHPDYQSD